MKHQKTKKSIYFRTVQKWVKTVCLYCHFWQNISHELKFRFTDSHLGYVLTWVTLVLRVSGSGDLRAQFLRGLHGFLSRKWTFLTFAFCENNYLMFSRTKFFSWPLKRQPNKMVKHTQANELFECIWPLFRVGA